MELLIGSDGLDRLQAASVAVFGVGGVGSYAVEALARAGVGRLTLVDFDNVCLTNINRQIHALEETVGRPKAEAMAERCRAINPQVDVSAVAERYSSDNSKELLAHPFDFVCDCIDDISAKLHLLQSCFQQKLPVISSMGAANKLDPAQVQVADLAKTTKCRLARIIRKELRKQGIEKGIRVVFSTEEFRPLDSAEGERKPLLGSSSWLPPIFGLTMASEVIRTLIGEID
ncbi:tRNA A37 threonylcarbamoyladenosine dehydratase [Malonomonas rubra DSM 5091]|uniref:tRNA A37 threonylcarbamoyladenosine dehydratase n=2 Tax=Malonomonas rubra TaxID=57040 RepID=A0A1M6HLI5_MALRU|nr:tRNA A37 threonylcarbamoyladenosine dehydratase [Malonomonas rubra DSM 5091]